MADTYPEGIKELIASIIWTAGEIKKGVENGKKGLNEHLYRALFQIDSSLGDIWDCDYKE